MTNAPDNSVERVKGSAKEAHDMPGRRSASAAHQLVQAVKADIAALAHSLRKRRPSVRIPSLRPPGRFGRVLKFALFTSASIAVIATLLIALTMLWVLRDLPLDLDSAEARDREILLTAADGKALGRVGPLKVSNASREEFPHHVVMAVLSVEDRRFYRHWGIDWVGTARAALRNYTAGAIVEGGSSITQQLVKLRLVGRERTFNRKLREAVGALWLEMRLSKDEILTRYLNSVYLGAGAQGLPAGAKLYFNKRPDDLTLSEAALLAGLIKAPSRYNPIQNPDVAHLRAAVVLDAMVGHGVIARDAAEEAKNHPAVIHYQSPEAENRTWFSEWVAAEAQDVSGTFARNIRVRTTLDTRLQELAERSVNQALDQYADRNVSQGALVAMRPDGAVLAMVGGRNYKDSQFNRAVQAQRQPGSAFKLFVYMAALRRGYTLDDTIDAGPIEIGNWAPDNFGGRSYGKIKLADAFANSINTAAVRLAQDVGIKEVIGAARDLGIEGSLPNVPSLALGSADVNLLNLTSAFAAILAGQAPVQPWGVEAFSSPERPRLITIGAPSAPQQRLGDLRDRLVDLLKLPVERGTGRGAALDGFSAGKTGTSQNYRDAWFIGFNDSLTVGVWVGNDDQSPMKGVTGGSAPATIWKVFMTKAGPLLSEQSHVEPPSDSVSQDDSSPSSRQEQASCDFRACGAKYQSFDAADCTYQPYGGGPRARCEKSLLPTSRGLPTRTTDVNDSPRSNRCNLDACAATYSSFRASDCTYQPLDGGQRRLCQK
jgi:penicillin-binding protein 1A